MSRFLSALAVLCVLVTASLGAQQANLAGSWDLTINGPQGPIAAEAVLKQEKDQLAGTITAPQGSAEVKGSVTGKTFALTFSMQGPDGPIDVKINGEADGDTVKGMLDFGMGQADFTGKKK